MSKNVTIAKLNTLVTANAVQFTKEMDRAAAVAKGRGMDINGALSGIGGALGVGLSAGAVIAFGKSIVDLGSQVTDLAAVADLSARSFQTISVLAGDNGIKMDEVAKASETMRQRLQDASANGADPLNKSLHKLGLTSQGLSGLNTEQKWEVLADRLVNARNKQEAMNIASEIFGTKIGPKLRTTLEELAGGVGKASQNMGGLILTDPQLKRLDEFGDSLDRLGKFAKIFTVNLLDGKVGFQELWRDAKAMAGYKEKFDKNDIRNPGGLLLPGGNASKMPDGTLQQQLNDKMLATQKKAWDKNDREYREELAEIAERKAKRMADPFYQIKVKKERKSQVDGLMDLYMGDSGTLGGLLADVKQRPQAMALNTPTDAYSRIGLMTGAQVPPEQKKQTEHLKEIDDTLKKIRTLLSNPNLAAYTN